MISPVVWAGLVGTVRALNNSGAYGLRFPERCPDRQAVCGSDLDALEASMVAEMPGLTWPLERSRMEGEEFFSQRQPFAPDTMPDGLGVLIHDGATLLRATVWLRQPLLARP